MARRVITGGLADTAATDYVLLHAIEAHPILLNRPFVKTPDGTRLCRPSELVLDMLENPDIGPFIKEDGEVIIDSEGKRIVCITEYSSCCLRGPRLFSLGHTSS